MDATAQASVVDTGPIGPADACGAWKAQGASSLKITTQVRGRFFGRAPEIERRHEMPVAVHQINQCSVVHGVVPGFGRDLLVVDAVFLRDRSDGTRIAGEPDDLRVEARQIVPERGD